MGRSLLDHPRPEGSGWRHVLAGRLDAWAHRSFVASLIVGGLVSLVYCVHLGSRIRFSDEGEYLRLAAQLSQHGRYSLDGVHATAFRPPGYPFLLGAARVVGVPVGALRSLNVLFFLVVIGASWWLANRIAGGAAACIAAPLVALNPVSIYVVGSLYPETMGSAILLTALVALVASRDSTHPLRLVVTSGMLFGLLIVTIPTLAFVVALVAVWLAVLKARRQAVVVILTALLLPAAWTGRNAAVMHTLAPVSTNGGLNLLLGNSPVTGPRSGVTADLSPYYRYAKAHHLGEVASDAYFRSSALHWIGAHPASAAVLYLEKTANYFAPFDRLATASESSPGKDILASIVYLPLLVLLVIRIGRWRRDPPGSAEVLLLSIYLLCAPVQAVFFTRVRFRFPVDPLLAVIASGVVSRFLAHEEREQQGAPAVQEA
jgi:4-amino-4-deoxy-L-arabinose transferase-like glycosyltransferase